MREILDVPINRLKPSPDNPRKSFNEDALLALAQSLKTSGCIVPLIISSTNTIIDGERRWRAAKIAGFAELPCIIDGSGADDAVEMSVVANLQREDLTPLEEAECYRELVSRGRSVAEIAERIGLDRTAVQLRLNLFDLPPPALQAVEDQRISTAHAELLGTVPQEVREQAANEILAPPGQEEPMSRTQAETWIRTRYRRSLADALWSRDDEDLPGGACSGCADLLANRVGCAQVLGAETTCLNPACASRKDAAAYAVAVGEEAAKLKCHELPWEDAQREFGNTGDLRWNSIWIDCDEYPDTGRLTHGATCGKTWRALCGESLPVVTLTRDGRGRMRHLVRFAEAREAAIVEGHGSLFARASQDAALTHAKALKAARDTAREKVERILARPWAQVDTGLDDLLARMGDDLDALIPAPLATFADAVAGARPETRAWRWMMGVILARVALHAPESQVLDDLLDIGAGS